MNSEKKKEGPYLVVDDVWHHVHRCANCNWERKEIDPLETCLIIHLNSTTLV